MKIAVVGCAHGELDKIYEAIKHVEETEQIRVDLLICCGDFQAVRNYDDLNCMAVPAQYRQLQTFYKYYSCDQEAPYFTVFIGGNHEASNYLSELPYGGWVAPKIFYMGFANVLRIGDLRIGGLSGIYKGQAYFQGHFECPPYTNWTLRSVYHVRQAEVFKLKQLKSPGLDIFISHDWPRGIHAYGNADQLFRAKPYFYDEAMRGELGSPAGEDLLHLLKPKFWFCGHMHVKFPAIVDHADGNRTQFLALDKCLPRRKYLQILDIGQPMEGELNASHFNYDPEWLAVLKSTNHLNSTSNRDRFMPGPAPGPSNERINFTPTDEELNEIQELFEGDFSVSTNFLWTAKPMFENEVHDQRTMRPGQKFYVNPQTSEFCEKLGIMNLNKLLARLRPQAVEQPYYEHCAPIRPLPSADVENPDEIALSDDDQDEIKLMEEGPSDRQVIAENPDAIKLDSDDDLEDEVKGDQDVVSDQGLESAPKRPYEEGESSAVSDAKTGTQDTASGFVLKKFKRRNLEMYQLKADEDELE